MSYWPLEWKNSLCLSSSRWGNWSVEFSCSKLMEILGNAQGSSPARVACASFGDAAALQFSRRVVLVHWGSASDTQALRTTGFTARLGKPSLSLPLRAPSSATHSSQAGLELGDTGIPWKFSKSPTARNCKLQENISRAKSAQVSIAERDIKPNTDQLLRELHVWLLCH